MKPYSIILLAAVTLLILLPGCKDDSTTLPPNVYIVGNSIPSAVFWKNGQQTQLDGPVPAYATGIFVSGTDVYISGWCDSSGKKIAKYWKNGIGHNLTDGTNQARANAAYFSGGNVYFAGFESNGTKNVATYWKNGIAFYISDGINDAKATSIFVAGNDVYVAGEETVGSSTTAK